ncbi:putative SWR1-complex protein [Elsinoe fawcettii]|nr:putative SWR1-complex protein [Elsinoe fawcettii]
MSAQDMRDMLGITPDAARPPPAKKRKLVEKRPLEKGMAREVSALMGERAPPVSMIQVQPKYKQRPKRHMKVTPWELASFKNEARDDDLVLHHWQKKQQLKTETSVGENGEAVPEEAKVDKVGKPYQFAKYNVQVDVPEYTEEVYEASMKSDDWSKEETDYLVTLVKDYGQKWAIVWDRYEFTPPEGEGKSRSMEDLKSRYYAVRAAILAHETPIASMNGQQYALYQLLTHFDAKQETSRKRMTEAHLYRSELEVQEETALLAELQRIMMHHTTLENARKDLRDRLDYPSSGSQSMQYTTSQALGQLFQQLLAADRSKKDRRLKELPNVQTHVPSSAHRDSITGQTNKRPRDSLASAVSSSEVPETRSRALSPHSKDRFFVSVHDKLSAGVSFASDKLSKPRIAKSTVQTERIAAVLTQLKVPDIIPLPTGKVVEEFEKLMGKVMGLLDMRKVAEREEAELKVREAEKGIKNGDSKEEEARGQKRSASVLSEMDGEGREKRSKSRHAT